jgi:hypothetical protein
VSWHSSGPPISSGSPRFQFSCPIAASSARALSRSCWIWGSASPRLARNAAHSAARKSPTRPLSASASPAIPAGL